LQSPLSHKYQTSSYQEDPNEINSELTDFDDNNIADFLMLSDSQMESLVTMVNDVDNTSGRHGDVSNNVALP
jgi:hypothetical protein